MSLMRRYSRLVLSTLIPAGSSVIVRKRLFHYLCDKFAVPKHTRIVRTMACRTEGPSASMETTQNRRTEENTLTSSISHTPPAQSSLTTQYTFIQPYISTSQVSSPTVAPENRDALTTGSWIGICAGVSIGVLLIAGAALFLVMRMRRRKKDASERYRAQSYPLKCILDERRVHTLLDLSMYRGLSTLN
ncbi:hypothetical protein PMIN02_005843 [Paraphaeosphaeria minitans]